MEDLERLDRLSLQLSAEFVELDAGSAPDSRPPWRGVGPRTFSRGPR